MLKKFSWERSCGRMFWTRPVPGLMSQVWSMNLSYFASVSPSDPRTTSASHGRVINSSSRPWIVARPALAMLEPMSGWNGGLFGFTRATVSWMSS